MERMILRTIPVSSLCKLFPERDPENERRERFTMLRNEPLSFQIAYRLEGTDLPRLSLIPEIESDLPLSLYEVGYVPLPHTETEGLPEQERPGLFLDPLFEKKINPPRRKLEPLSSLTETGEKTIPHAARDCFKALWITVNESGRKIPAGEHTVRVRFLSRRDGELVGEDCVSLRVEDACLPRNDFLYINWVHCDCLSDLYGVPLFSDRFFEIYAAYIRMAAAHGMNTLLTPCFTPPLDTPIGEYRMPVQLVGVVQHGKKYEFDFTLLRRFLHLALDCGITHFEHSHLFSQWGAEYAPAVYATVRGKTKRIFGWDTPVAHSAYPDFLRAYLPALLAFLREEKLDKRFLFHISDEPQNKDIPAYVYAQSIVADILRDYPIIDAIFSYETYTKAGMKTPVVVTSNADTFVGRCANLWCYYTGGQCTDGLSNRMTVHSARRNRMLGLQMYAADAKGFLHWAYNYYYDELSQGLFDPLANPDGFLGRGPGSTYMVYPAPNGTPIASTRMKVFYEGLCDLRALRALEKKRGRAYVLAFMEERLGKINFHTLVDSDEKLLSFREEVNAALAAK